MTQEVRPQQHSSSGDPDSRRYAFLATSWVLTSASTLVVDRASVAKKFHDKTSGDKLPLDDSKTHVSQAFELLDYAFQDGC